MACASSKERQRAIDTKREIAKARWSLEEDELLLKLVAEATGRVQWVDFVGRFPGRNTAMLRNRHLRISRKLPCTYKDGKGRKNKCRACGQILRGHICPKR